MNILLRHVAKALRYHALTEIIGSRVTIDSLDTLATDILHTLAPPLPMALIFQAPEPRYLIGPLRKYGLLDLTFALPEPIPLHTDIHGIALLKELGFVSEPDQASPWDETVAEQDDDPTCLTELAEDMRAPQTFVRLLLEETPTQARRYNCVPMVDRLTVLPTNYFPRAFTVIDACMANSRFVWFHKHFYV